MSIVEVKNSEVIALLFEGRDETFVLSYLQGCMGEGYCDDAAQPRAAQIITGDICFFAGEADEALVRHAALWDGRSYLIMVPPDERWAAAIEAGLGERASRRMRYALRREPEVFDPAKLERFACACPAGYTLKPVDEQLYERARGEEWSADLCWNYPTYAHYAANGLGVVALEGEEIVAGASSYIFYRDGIEIEVDTREDRRRRGLATACAARLILECLARGLYPSWDAHNRESLALAEKLGYRFDREYPAYDVVGM